MMRANLLPRAVPRFELFGISLDADNLQRILALVGWVALAAATAAGVELFRLHRLEAEASRQVALARANDARRAAARALALEVAHLQEVRDYAAELRESGNEAALQIARVGNAVPSGVWLDRLAWNARTFELGGESWTIEAAGSTAALLEREFPKGRAVLTDLHRRENDRYVFAAELELGE